MYLDEKGKMGSYDCEERAKRIVEKVRMGIMASFMIEEAINMDASVPEYAREKVIKLTKEML